MSSRNEVMNFLRLIIFSEFFMIFQEFLELKYLQKGVYMRWTRAELTWHDADTWRCHGGGHRPTWVPTWDEAHIQCLLGPRV